MVTTRRRTLTLCRYGRRRAGAKQGVSTSNNHPLPAFRSRGIAFFNESKAFGFDSDSLFSVSQRRLESAALGVRVARPISQTSRKH